MRGFWYAGRFILNQGYFGRPSKEYWDCLNNDVRIQLRTLPVNPLRLNKTLQKMLTLKSQKLVLPYQ